MSRNNNEKMYAELARWESARTMGQKARRITTLIIDNSFSGTNDVWKFPALAMRDTVIHEGDRICQFRIEKKQPEIEFIEVAELDSVDRGSFGSTGVK